MSGIHGSIPAPRGGYTGLTCYNADSCGNESPAGASAQDVDLRAMVAGWQMGLDREGQAHYSCPGCAFGLFDTHEHQPSGWWNAGRLPGIRRKVSGSVQLWHELQTGAWYGTHSASTATPHSL